MKPNWQQLIRAHSDPLVKEGVKEGTVFVLKRGIVAITIKTHGSGSPRAPRGQGIPFLFQRGPTPRGMHRISLDLSNGDFLVYQKNESYSVAGQTYLFAHKHCIPWEHIAEIEFIEEVPV
jgi:hypothetical protein